MNRTPKTRFDYKSITLKAGVPVPMDFRGNFFVITAVVGSVEFSLNGSDWNPVPPVGWTFNPMPGELFGNVWLRSIVGGSINFYYGFGNVSGLPSSNGGGGAGAQQVYIGVVDNPNGVVVPDDQTKAAVYYKDQANPAVVWCWSVANLNWFNALS
jgi:hypothetical protein